MRPRRPKTFSVARQLSADDRTTQVTTRVTAPPRLHPALALLLNQTAEGPSLLETAAQAGVTIRIDSLTGAYGTYRPSTRTVTLDTRVASQSVRGQAAVLAHELRHAVQWAGIGRITQGIAGGNSFSCYSREAGAVATELAVWQEVKGDGPPADALEREEEYRAHAMQTHGVGFWLEMHSLYYDHCG